MKEFGKRLREVRESLSMNQTEFSAIAGVGQKAQINYEKGDRKPDCVYLSNLSKIGVDVQYIITGVKFDNSLTKEEENLIQALRESEKHIQMIAISTAHATLVAGKIYDKDFE